MATKMQLKLIAEYPSESKEGDLLVWHFHSPPHTMDRYIVEGVNEAKSLIRRLTKHDLDDINVTENAFGLVVYNPVKVDGDDRDEAWEEWEDGEGNDILAVIDAEDAAAERVRKDEKNGLVGGKVDEAN